ncbi:MAG: Asp-tRNA(Asn)/Glu-tRNA(Gln) amidotransferase subunit GatB [Candidatus Melainabacteria bacterium]|nr:Asp-tRNA(Asn)/Glu-tRNA(Gln) amidotransferase subunit GatB [Candidatus Melainabacteria bacterium]
MTTQTLPATYETVIGLEVHVQLNTASKLFCPDATTFGEDPNRNTCPVCLGMPGVLPVLNGQALESAIRIGLALNCQIATVTKFDRKQYFYPDLPKAYQISQYDQPVCGEGFLRLNNGRRVGITRAHLEEDAGKLVHAGADGLAGSTHSRVDLNRAGTPLVEIVSEPDLRSAEEARDYLMQIRNLVRYLGVCDGNLEEGSMRCDANVSLRPVGSNTYGTKAEIKNMNSFRAVQRAIEAEVARQTRILNEGGRVRQETRLWNDATGETVPMRSKEEAHDYRYFPEPDLRPLHLDLAWVETLRASQPELPDQRFSRLTQQSGLSDYDAGVLVEFKELGDFFDRTLEHTTKAKAVANWLMGDISAYLKTEKLSLTETQLSPEALAQLVERVEDGTISGAIAKKVLPELLAEGGLPDTIVAAKGLVQVSDPEAIRPVIEQILKDNPDNVAAYRAGKTKLFGFFVGQAMKATQGKANPELINQLLQTLLEG